MSRADFRSELMGGLNAPLDVEDTITRVAGFDATPFWQGEISQLLTRADRARSTCPSGRAVIALRWRRSFRFRRPEREGKFERGADKSSAQKVDHLTAPSLRYFSELPTSVKAVLTFVPTAWTAATINTAIKLAISAYSIAVTPS
jgi:hypothetical protein